MSDFSKLNRAIALSSGGPEWIGDFRWILNRHEMYGITHERRQRTTAKFYRYHDVVYGSCYDDDGFSRGPGRLAIELLEFSVTKRTAKGVWLDGYRFVRNAGRKRYALPTKEEALISYKARKRAEIRIYKARLSRAQRALEMAENLNGCHAQFSIPE